jgi:tetratricopeptide (TPR) repeat protein
LWTTPQADGLDTVALLIALAEIEESLGNFRQARTTAHRAATILSPIRDPDEDTFRLWCQAEERLAGLDRLAGDLDAAEERLVNLLKLATRSLGPSSQAVVSANNALAVVYKHAGRFDDAEAAYGRARRCSEAGGHFDPLVEAALCHNLAGLAHSRGRAGDGIPQAEHGLALRIGVVGSDHPDTGRDLNALGALYHQAGRLDEAEAAYKRALKIFESVYGPHHFEVAMVCANLAVAAVDRGRNPAAEALGRRALAILVNVLGPDHTEVALTMHNLGVAVAEQGRAEEAAKLFDRANGILAAGLPEHHPYRTATSES